jgi:ATP-dependent RNA helicase DHX37/DHR1
MKNKKLKGKGFNAVARKGTSSKSEPSSLNVAHQKSQKSQKKKEKKLESFVAKELKKEESKQIMLKLANNKFDLKLLDSSATVGKKKTRNERLIKNELMKNYSFDQDHEIDFGQDESDQNDFTDEDVVHFKQVNDERAEVFEMDAFGHTVQSDAKRKITEEQVITKRKRTKSKKSINTIKGAGPITIPIINQTVPEHETIKPEFAPDEKAYFVTVERTPEIEAQRMNLPVVQQEQQIMETILANSTTIICGETGSGKVFKIN